MQLYEFRTKLNRRRLVHFVTDSESHYPPFVKGETDNAPFTKGGRA